ncbi:hypothetical protein I7I50_09483 [Histoplasma capsulatum G186AR]|nr:hypothetical protein I7I50_09483 [Histoplasma capsulatum G186AR]
MCDGGLQSSQAMPIRSNLIQPLCQNNNVTDRNKVKGESRDLRPDEKIKEREREREREREFVCVCGCVYVKNKTDKKEHDTRK